MDSWSIVQGYAGEWTITVRDEYDDPVTTYTGAEALAGTVGPGRSYAPSFTLAPTWLSAAAGTITVAISKDRSAALTPGQYRVNVGLADGSADFFEGSLVVEWGAGTDALPPTYCDYVDMLNYVPWLGKLQAEGMVAGFAPERGRAREWLDQIIINRFNYQSLAPSSGQPGFSPLSNFPSTAIAPPNLWLREQLNLDSLVRRQAVIEVVAKKAIYYVCRAQLSRLEEQEARLGAWFGREADGMVRSLRAEITLDVYHPNNLDTWPSITVDCGAASLRG